MTLGRVWPERAGAPIDLDPGVILRTAQWLVSREPRMPARVPLPVDLLVPPTRTSEGEEEP